MTARHAFQFPSYTTAERVVDGIIHVSGILGGVVGAAVILVLVLPRASAAEGLSVAVYCAGLVAMLTFSGLYNLARPGAAKRVLRRLDHAAIYVMIAATYTPFAGVKIGGAWGWGLLAAVWAAAVVGVVLALLGERRGERVSLVLYLLMGWSILAALRPLLDSVTAAVAWLLLGGGAIYTLGVAFHLWRGLRFHNAIWHACVLLAAACHYAAVFAAMTGSAASA